MSGLDLLGAFDLEQARKDAEQARKDAARAEDAKKNLDYTAKVDRAREDAEKQKQQQNYLSYLASKGKKLSASGLVVRSCGASGMTIWHYLFFALIFAGIFFAPQILAFSKRRFVFVRNKWFRSQVGTPEVKPTTATVFQPLR
jgi:hypothetical protein